MQYTASYGIAGPTGNTGPQGPTGNTGPQGPSGSGSSLWLEGPGLLSTTVNIGIGGNLMISGNIYMANGGPVSRVYGHDANTTNNAMYINAIGNIGVGTTKPVSRIGFGKTLSKRVFGLWDNDLDWYGLGVQPGQMLLQVGNNGGRFSFIENTNSSEVATITGFGNVGIGTTDPSQRLEVSGNIKITAGTGAGLVFQDGTVQYTASYGVAGPTGNTGPQGPTGSTGPQGPAGSGTSSWQDGLGIVTTTGNVKVSGNLTISGNLYITNGGPASRVYGHHNNTTDNAMYIDAVGNIGVGTTAPVSRIGFAKTLSNRVFGLWDKDTDWYGLGVQPAQMRLQIGNSGARFAFIENTNGAEVMSIQGRGNVGVGVVSPDAKFAVSGNIKIAQGSGGGLIFQDGTVQYTASTAIVGPTGNTGPAGPQGPAGTPGASLWTDGAGLVSTTANVGIGGNLIVSGNLNIANGGPVSRVYGHAAYTTNNAMYINASGNIGVGTTTPVSRIGFAKTLSKRVFGLWDSDADWYGLGVQSGQMLLQIGNSGGRFSFIENTNGVEVATITGFGNVGIGITNPVESLEVSGNVKANIFKGTLIGDLQGFQTSIVTSKSVHYVVGSGDEILLGNASAGIQVFTLPTATTIKGRRYTFKKVDSSGNAVTIDANGSETIDGALTYNLNAQWSYVEIVSDGNNWLVVGKN